jgi:hypothetical protein
MFRILGVIPIPNSGVGIPDFRDSPDLNIQKLKCSYSARKITVMEYLEQIIEAGPKFGEEKKKKK